MSEQVLYLKNDRCDTEKLRSAAYDLNNRTLDTAETCIYRIRQVDPLFNQDLSIPFSLRLATSPGQLARSVQEKWEVAETRLLHQLQLIGIFRHPKRVALRLAEFLDQVPAFQTHHEAFGYFKDCEERIGFLLSKKGQSRLDSIKLTSYSLVESLVLRRAIYEGVYLTKPTNHIPDAHYYSPN